uniref:Serine/threonine-protein phosphatase n=1 Tax=Panagrellus redivivus TaxID=6233 RepID=A0A7E4UQ03_PANRE
MAGSSTASSRAQSPSNLSSIPTVPSADPTIAYTEHEKKWVAKPEVRGLAKRFVNRLIKHQTIDGFTDDEVNVILNTTIELLSPAPAFIRMTAPVVIFGDTHGQFSDLLRLFGHVGYPPSTRVLFLGDYVDRGRKSIEIVMLLFALKLLYPTQVQVLRGNHECAKMNRLYGFYEQCRRDRGVVLWKKFNQVFNELPLCCLVSERIICMHGGISPDIKSLDTLYKLKKPRTHAECDTGVALDLMWSDPAAGADACCSWQFNKMRNASWMFGTESVKEFNRILDIDIVVRAHEVCRNGHLFYCDKNLVTVFSAPNYCGTDGNAASVMRVSKDLKYSFLTMKPRLNKNDLSKEKMELLDKQNKNDIKSPNPMPKGGPPGLASYSSLDMASSTTSSGTDSSESLASDMSSSAASTASSSCATTDTSSASKSSGK